MEGRAVLSLLVLVIGLSQTVLAQTFTHPGLLHRQEDFDRMKSKVNAGDHPWIDSWNLLIANSHSSLTWTPNPAPTVYRGTGYPENYGQLYNDIAAGYADALRWKITGDTAYADKAVQIMNAWSSTLTLITGSSDADLAAGIYGYQFANVAEIMRTYSGWPSSDFIRFKNMMLNVFYPINHDFLVRHNNACISHYWANWDLCNMASIIAIGVLCDDRAKYNEAVDYFKTGEGNGSIGNAVYYLFSPTLGQWQESGRDQGHATLGPALMGAFCEMAWNQGTDLYAYSNRRFLAGCEYVATYNLGNSVPYVTYDNCNNVNQTVIASAGRGDIRPTWELLYNHYAMRMGLSVPYTASYAAKVRPEGGGGNYGPNSGGYDQLGYGTLTCTLDPAPIRNGTYRVVSRKSGKALTVSDNGTAEGTQIIQSTYQGATGQLWNVTSLGNGQYKIIGAGSGESLDINRISTADGAKLQIWPYNGGDNQRFTFILTTDGHYRITPVHSGKCLDVDVLSTSSDAIVQQWSYHGANNQQWILQER